MCKCRRHRWQLDLGAQHDGPAGESWSQEHLQAAPGAELHHDPVLNQLALITSHLYAAGT